MLPCEFTNRRRCSCGSSGDGGGGSEGMGERALGLLLQQLGSSAFLATGVQCSSADGAAGGASGARSGKWLCNGGQELLG